VTSSLVHRFFITQSAVIDGIDMKYLTFEPTHTPGTARARLLLSVCLRAIPIETFCAKAVVRFGHTSSLLGIG